MTAPTYSRQTLALTVSLQDGVVTLTQDDPTGEHDHIIDLPPEQVPLVCKWLMEAAAAAQANTPAP